jgi:hypothetical protein
LRPPSAAVGSEAEAGSDRKSSDDVPNSGIPTRAPNRAPTIACTPAPSAPPGKIYEFRPTAQDQDGHTLTYGILGKPKWAAFSAETGELRGIPGNGDIGTYENITISASDGQYTVSLPPFRIQVGEGGPVSITLNWLPPTEGASGKPLQDLAGYKIYWGSKRGDYPNQVTLKSPGVASYVLERLSPGTYYIVLTAFNSRGEESGFSNVVSNTL